MSEGPLETLVFHHTEFIDLFQQKSSHLVLPFFVHFEKERPFCLKISCFVRFVVDWRCVTETTFLSIKIQELQPWTSAALTEESKKKSDRNPFHRSNFLWYVQSFKNISPRSKQDPTNKLSSDTKIWTSPPKKNTEFHIFPSRIYPIFVHQIQVLHCAPNGHRPCHLHKWMRCRKKKKWFWGEVRFDFSGRISPICFLRQKVAENFSGLLRMA